MKWSTVKFKLPLFLLAFLMVFSSLFSPSAFAAKPDRKVPTTPYNLRAVLVAENSITLEWNGSTDNVGVVAYSIYKDNLYIGGSTVNKYTVNGLTSATAYKFYVNAKDAAGNTSKSSNIITVKTLSLAPTPEPEPEPTPVPTQNRVVGYYAAWAAYSGYTPDKVDASKLTHINYAFANISSDLKITLGYPDIDTSNINKLNALKQTNPNLKTLISIGGWSWSGKFSDAALTEESRSIFADSCVDFIVKYGFDGIDLDWEYPVSGGCWKLVSE